ncbi:MAG: hypothetical protein KF752_05620 [Pirellulaceae bacterium]|nr:hypothetical protein [Pirellulaceae bacterium]
MSRQSWWQRIYWSRWAKPVEERVLFRFLIQHTVGSVLEIGVGNGARMARLARLVNPVSPQEPLRYIGVDEFESSAADRPHLTLKQAHQRATALGFKASLIPGTLQMAIPRVAHKFGPSDLILIDGGIDLQHPATGPIGGWLNRLAHSQSTVIASQHSGGPLVIVDSRKLELPIAKAA